MHATIPDVLKERKKYRPKPKNDELRRLPDREATGYGRVSSPGQIRDSTESIREIAHFIDLAKQDGYKTELDSSQAEEWLLKIQGGLTEPSVLKDGEFTLDCRDLGISGLLGQSKRPGLASVKRRLERKELGAIYVSEPSRLSRDQDKIEPYVLLKLMKDSNCKVRTPEEILSPCIDHDWDILDEEFQDAHDETKVLNRRLFRKKQAKAKRGEYVGTPVCAGFYLPIKERRKDGSYVFGKITRYEPHVLIVEKALRELVSWRNPYHAMRALKGVNFPFFPPELAYMESRTSLRSCLKTVDGYRITAALLCGLAQNLALIGHYIYGDIVIEANHEQIVGEGLFWEAYEVVRSKKPRGRAAYHEPLPLDGILWCGDHQDLRPISAHNGERTYVCDSCYRRGEQNSICLHITSYMIDVPLTTVVLSQLDLSPLTESVLETLESEIRQRKLDKRTKDRQRMELENTLANLRVNLGRTQNAELISEYEAQILKVKEQLANLGNIRLPENAVTGPNVQWVRDFLRNLRRDWDGYSGTFKNRLLKLLIKMVIIRRNEIGIEATIIWRTGFEYRVTIQRPMSRSRRERRWSHDDDKVLRRLYPTSSSTTTMAALPSRSWQAIAGRAFRLKIPRIRQYHPPVDWRLWTMQEDEQLAISYQAGIPLYVIADNLKRSVNAIEARASLKRLPRPASSKCKKRNVTWECHDLKPLAAGPWGR